MELLPDLQAALNRVPGMQVASFPRPSLPGSARGFPVQFVIMSSAGFDELDRVTNELLEAATDSVMFGLLLKCEWLNLSSMAMARKKIGILQKDDFCLTQHAPISPITLT